MKYEKNQYSEGVSFCSLVIAGAFLFWGFNNIRGGSWWGWILIAIGLSTLFGQIAAIKNRSKLKNIVLTEITKNPNITQEEIAQHTSISRKDIKAIILDLKGSGALMGTFSSQTGQMQLASPPVQKRPPQDVPTPEVRSDLKFCNECGTEINKDEHAKFCPHCGSVL
ncbi:hypothetical protein NEF87_000439 [Candidatus Lokiarchaeum ossiferum]|uniref:Zinc-ribbon domain-containing protein n=1 Tax=Candidatus Lokiarchaeum ossiferum TaxID=2951803 RepID=A0ABY6HKW2_9ARCH|nr:hypothetical protein NEF87_000439 [Candidatus Lokiarchaeum sp. B-35]